MTHPKYYKKEIKKLLKEKVYDDVIAMDAVYKFLNNDLIQPSKTEKEQIKSIHHEVYKDYKINIMPDLMDSRKLIIVISKGKTYLRLISTVKINHSIYFNKTSYIGIPDTPYSENHSISYDYGATLRESVEQAKAIIDFVIDEKENSRRETQDLFSRITFGYDFEEFE